MTAEWRFDAIGTPWSIETTHPLGDDARADVTALIDGFDREWSRFRDDSVVSRLAVAAGEAPLPVDADDMLRAYSALSNATAGAVNPLVGNSLERLGYGAGYRLTAAEPEAAPEHWRRVLSWDDSLTVTAPVMIDVGALGKGRLVDRVLALVETHVAGAAGEVADVIVDASGDMAVRGDPVRVGLEHPYDSTRAIGVITLRNAALCASAVNRRAWGDGLHHVVDARTGLPVDTVAATWAVAPDAMSADAIATALFFEGGTALAHEWGVEWVRMLTTGRVEFSPGSEAELFSRAASVG